MRLNFALLSKPVQTAGAVGTLGAASLHEASHCPRSFSNAGGEWGQHPVNFTQKPGDKLDSPPLPPSTHSLRGHGKPSESASVPGVPAVPVEILMNEFDHEIFEERVAIMEFDGGVSRAEAERLAMMLLAGS